MVRVEMCAWRRAWKMTKPWREGVSAEGFIQDAVDLRLRVMHMEAPRNSARFNSPLCSIASRQHILWDMVFL